MSNISIRKSLIRASRLTADGQFFGIYLPYQFCEIRGAPRRHTYLPVNRYYNPLGDCDREYRIYEQFQHRAVVFSLDPHKIVGVWHNPETLTLYNDDPFSRLDYFERLEHLCRFTMPLLFSLPPTAAEQQEFRRAHYQSLDPDI